MRLSIKTWYKGLIKYGPGEFDFHFRAYKPHGHYVSYNNDSRTVSELQADGIDRFCRPGSQINLIPNGYVLRERGTIQKVTLDNE